MSILEKMANLKATFYADNGSHPDTVELCQHELIELQQELRLRGEAQFAGMVGSILTHPDGPKKYLDDNAFHINGLRVVYNTRVLKLVK